MPDFNHYIVKSPPTSAAAEDISVGAYYKRKFDTIIAEDPAAVALIEFETSTFLTYKELDARALELGAALLHQGVTGDDRVLFFADNSLEYFTSILAFTYLGVPFSPSKPANGAYETYQQMTSLGAAILVISASKFAIVNQLLTSSEYCEEIRALLKLVVVMGDDEGVVAQKLPTMTFPVVTSRQLTNSANGYSLPQVPYFEIDPERDCYVIAYTSGTTGLPKGAVHTHRTFVATLESILSMAIFTEYIGCKICNIFPFGHISGTIFVPVALLNSMPSLLYRDLDHKKILKSVEHYEIECLPLVLELATDLYTTDYSDIYDLTSLRAMYFGGSKFPEHILSRLGEKYLVSMHEFYGATEFMGSVGVPSDRSLALNGSVGVPMAGVEMKITDLHSHISLPPGQVGEICFRGPNRFVGYLDNEKATRETIDEHGWYHSGDVGYYDAEGRLYMTERIKELIKYKHWSIAPAEIEVFLASHEAVAAACVVGVSHSTEGAHLRAYVKITEGRGASERELVEFVKANMGYQKRLNAGVVFVKEIPRSVIGKIERQHFKSLVKHEIITRRAVEESH